MTEKDIEKMLNENAELDMSHIDQNDILAKARQELYFSSPSSAKKPIKKKKSFFSIFTSKRLVPLLAGVACAFTLFVGMIGLYNENYQTIYIDVNPSVALTLNRFDRVIEVKFLNDDAKNILDSTDLIGSDIEKALETVISTCDKAGYVKDDSQIYLSATSKEEKNSEKLLAKLKDRTEKMKNSESESYSVSTYNTKKGEKEKFEKSNLSPAKDKIIREIADEDKNYKLDDLKDKSMYELSNIKKKLNKHENNGKHPESNGNAHPSPDTETVIESESETVTETEDATDTKTEIITDTETEIITDTETELITDTETETVIETETESEKSTQKHTEKHTDNDKKDPPNDEEIFDDKPEKPDIKPDIKPDDKPDKDHKDEDCGPKDTGKHKEDDENDDDDESDDSDFEEENRQESPNYPQKGENPPECENDKKPNKNL